MPQLLFAAQERTICFLYIFFYIYFLGVYEVDYCSINYCSQFYKYFLSSLEEFLEFLFKLVFNLRNAD